MNVEIVSGALRSKSSTFLEPVEIERDSNRLGDTGFSGEAGGTVAPDYTSITSQAELN